MSQETQAGDFPRPEFYIIQVQINNAIIVDSMWTSRALCTERVKEIMAAEGKMAGVYKTTANSRAGSYTTLT